MRDQTNPSKPTSDGELLITHTFNAPRDVVWRAWSDLDYLKRWHAPAGCVIDFVRFDFREGGGFHSCIKNPAFGDCWCVGVYREIRKPERIVYTMAVADQSGNLVTPATAGHDPEWPAETTVTLTFEERDGKTRLTLHQTVSESLAKRTGAHPSWLGMLGRLDKELAASGRRTGHGR
jgi:uncharacterized protein YndB with AHSA1/START domain